MSSVDHHPRSRHKDRGIGSQKQGDAPDLLRVRSSTHGYTIDHLLALRCIKELPVQVRRKVSRAEAIHLNTKPRPLQGQRFGELDYPYLTGAVRAV